MIRDIIRKYHGTMQRSILMTKMPSTNCSDWRKWAQELEEQARRIDWANYDWKVAALDALLYQCPDAIWGQKILTGNIDFNEAVAYAVRHLTAKSQAKELGLSGNTDMPASEPVDRLEHRTTFDSARCRPPDLTSDSDTEDDRTETGTREACARHHSPSATC